MKTDPTLIAALDLGRAKIAVVVAECRAGSRYRILGMAEQPTRNALFGKVSDLEVGSRALRAALREAGIMAQRTVTQVVLAVSGSHIRGQCEVRGTTVTTDEGKVDAATVAALEYEKLEEKYPGVGSVCLHAFLRAYRLDGRVIAGKPIGKIGHRLEVERWVVSGSSRRLDATIDLVEGCDCEVQSAVLAGQASGAACTTPRERKSGVLVLDVGAEMTDFSLYRDGRCYAVGTIPLAGAHLTRELAGGLEISPTEAEAVKLRYGRAVVRASRHGDGIWLGGASSRKGRPRIARRVVEEIIAASTQEILGRARQTLGESFAAEACAAGVRLTGGTARLPGIAACAKDVFGVPARAAGPRTRALSGRLQHPQFSTVVGLLEYRFGRSRGGARG